MPTSASRRVWEGKAGNYSAKVTARAIPLRGNGKPGTDPGFAAIGALATPPATDAPVKHLENWKIHIDLLPFLPEIEV